MVDVSGELRRSAGLRVPEPGSDHDRDLIELIHSTLGFLAGDPIEGLAAALQAWQSEVSSVEEARADLSAVGATLDSRLAGPTPKLHRLVEELIAGQEARLSPAGTGVDPVPALVRSRRGPRPGPARRRPPRRSPRQLSKRLTYRLPKRLVKRPPNRRQRRRPHPAIGRSRRWLPVGGMAYAVVAGVAALTGLLSLVPPGAQTALLPNYRQTPGPAAPTAPAPHNRVAASPPPLGPASPHQAVPAGADRVDHVVLAAAVVKPTVPGPVTAPAATNPVGSTPAGPTATAPVAPHRGAHALHAGRTGPAAAPPPHAKGAKHAASVTPTTVTPTTATPTTVPPAPITIAAAVHGHGRTRTTTPG